MSGLRLTELRQAYIAGSAQPDEVFTELVERAEACAEDNIWIQAPSMERLQPYLHGLQDLDPAEAPLWGIPFAVKDNIDVAGLLQRHHALPL